ncbi:MAG TPA: L-seryl-tRNA(Sec) selenium transferase [Bryobacteraceae bacterium]|nr:L-seryl-tRNA(Sec) selenium transferase [Bryobacteraceae bacterium]
MKSLRNLPSVDQVLRELGNVDGFPREVVVCEIRSVLAEIRETGSDSGPIGQLVRDRLRALAAPSLRRVINATGVVLHTNLGRAPLAAFTPIDGYSNLEYDLTLGKRGRRDSHTARLLERLLDRPAIVVNNNAAAVYLVLKELAFGHEVIVSRGELIEIGDGFRIPEIMASSGAIVREVGTTNRTHLADYRDAINERTRLILRVHPSNFHISGFTARPDLRDLAALGREKSIPVFEDLGSGCLANGIEEPLVTDSLSAGANVVSFSCDKLMGGPQAGIIAGDAQLVARVRRNPVYRALRVDKLIIQALETTLGHLIRQDWQAIPALRMMFAGLDEIRSRAERLALKLEDMRLSVRPDESVAGGGSLPGQTVPTWVIELDVPSAVEFEKRLRTGACPVVSRIESGKIVLDLRTVDDREVDALAAAVKAATQPLPQQYSQPAHP